MNTSSYTRYILEKVDAERNKQISKGYDKKHDKKHDKGELIHGAVAYALNGLLWPWDKETFKLGESKISRLIKSCAMLVAEIEREMDSVDSDNLKKGEYYSFYRTRDVAAGELTEKIVFQFKGYNRHGAIPITQYTANGVLKELNPIFATSKTRFEPAWQFEIDELKEQIKNGITKIH